MKYIIHSIVILLLMYISFTFGLSMNNKEIVISTIEKTENRQSYQTKKEENKVDKEIQIIQQQPKKEDKNIESKSENKLVNSVKQDMDNFSKVLSPKKKSIVREYFDAYIRSIVQEYRSFLTLFKL